MPERTRRGERESGSSAKPSRSSAGALGFSTHVIRVRVPEIVPERREGGDRPLGCSPFRFRVQSCDAQIFFERKFGRASSDFFFIFAAFAGVEDSSFAEDACRHEKELMEKFSALHDELRDRLKKLDGFAAGQKLPAESRRFVFDRIRSYRVPLKTSFDRLLLVLIHDLDLIVSASFALWTHGLIDLSGRKENFAQARKDISALLAHVHEIREEASGRMKERRERRAAEIPVCVRKPKELELPPSAEEHAAPAENKAEIKTEKADEAENKEEGGAEPNPAGKTLTAAAPETPAEEAPADSREDQPQEQTA